MNNQNILVYDTTEEISKFIKKHYLHKFTIDFCTDFKLIHDYDYSKYDIFFVIINESKDMLFLFQTISNKNNTLFIGTYLEEIREKFIINERFKYLNLYQTEEEMIQFININININATIKNVSIIKTLKDETLFSDNFLKQFRNKLLSLFLLFFLVAFLYFRQVCFSHNILQFP